MFFELVFRNSKRSRKDNHLYFSSMIISIIAFYMILSLSHQDVMLFLKKMESDAVTRLLAMIPVFYVVTLVLLFFLVYFASSMQMQRRTHEFGVYLTLGMKRSKLFMMLLLEDFRNNLISLGIGLPIAIMLSELISLITAKVVGLGIITHRFSLSTDALLFTVMGFLGVKFAAIVFLSAKTSSREIGELLNNSVSGMKKSFSKWIYFLSIVIGIIMLAKAYEMGIQENAWHNIVNMSIAVSSGIIGTILLVFGMRIIIGFLIKFGSKKELHTYNFRQVQELVIHRSALPAICSLLIFCALCFFASGIAISTAKSNTAIHLLDYTFKEIPSEHHKEADSKLEKSDETSSDNEEEKTSETSGISKLEKVKEILKSENLEDSFSKILEIKVGHSNKANAISFENVRTALEKIQDSKSKDRYLRSLRPDKYYYLIALSGYNELKKAADEEPIELKDKEAILYMNRDFLSDEQMLNEVLGLSLEADVYGENMKLLPKVESLPLVTDRAISIRIALIVEDNLFDLYTAGDYSTYVSAVLDHDLVKEKGLMGAISQTNEALNQTSLRYESHIQNMGRTLFFVISASYITTYLAIVFLVVANTIIAVMFLMGQRKSHKRYQTLIHLGATYEILCKSCAKQINWYFGLPILLAIINSFFGVQSLFQGILPSEVKNNFDQQMIIAIGMILLLGVFEFAYIFMVKKHSDRYLWTLMEPKRED